MKTARILVSVALLAAVTVGFTLFPVREWFQYFATRVESLGALGPAVVALIYVLGTVLLIPGSAITLGAATLFELKTALVVVFVGANLGALCSFALARTFLRERVARWAAAKPKFRSLDHAIGRQGFKIVLLARLSPIFPFNTLNYLLGVTPVKTGAYVVGNLVGMLPGMILYVYIGAAARDALTHWNGASFELFQQGVKYVGLVATLALVFIITRIAQKAIREPEQKSAGPLSSLPRGGGDVREGS
jgi:uncharacterized membrane protein YdjX (TVP38/TMEM64 family)